MKKSEATVDTPSPQMRCLEEKRQLCRDLMGGTTAMIKAGKKWLPKHPGESDANYKVRLEGNVLTNFLSLAVDKQVGKVLGKPVTLKDNVPSDITSICENIDRQGRGLHPFIIDVAKDAFTSGISYVLADHPRTEGTLTRADEKSMGIKPYAVHVKACCLLEALSAMVDGTETLIRVRIRECMQQPAAGGFDYEEVEQVRVLIRQPDTGAITYELWRENEKKDEWVKVEEGSTTFKRITLVPFYTNRTGFMMGEPPNQATAELNLRHWRSMAEQIYALSFQRFGMLGGKGVDPESKVVVGPGMKAFSSDPQSEFYYIEPTGKGVEMGRLDLESIEKAIETASATLRIERAGTVTATAAAIDSDETNAGLRVVGEGFEDSIEQLFQHFAEMLGQGTDSGGEVELSQDFGTAKGTPQGLQSLDKARALGDISRQNYLQSLIWRGELPSDFDIATNDEELQSEGPALGTIGTGGAA